MFTIKADNDVVISMAKIIKKYELRITNDKNKYNTIFSSSLVIRNLSIVIYLKNVIFPFSLNASKGTLKPSIFLPLS